MISNCEIPVTVKGGEDMDWTPIIVAIAGAVIKELIGDGDD